jgi:hypothetical protein
MQAMYVACVPLKKTFVGKTLSSLVEKTMTTYVQPPLVNYLSTICTFYLWMSKGTHDVFDVVNFISNDWEGKHVTVKLFEVLDTSGVTMAPKL